MRMKQFNFRMKSDVLLSDEKPCTGHVLNVSERLGFPRNLSLWDNVALASMDRAVMESTFDKF